jgi:plastocyanin
MARPRRLALLVTPLLLLVAALAAPATQAGGGCHVADGSVYTEGDGTSVIRMDVCSFAPTVSTVPVGTAVRFLNTATIPHQVAGRAGSWGSDILEPGQEYSARFDKVGTYPYTCPLHPGMVGAIRVGDGVVKGADLAVTTRPADPAPTQPDPTPLVLAGLLGLGIGIALGVVVARVRPRTTG